ncbi:hypothetical protein [Kineothrix sp. MB12-C1]|uniref:hypothetical protein n=1 Tax=Kineothrix sp. MB12-C1 TaxID=3070215 RepID=UPI0027D1EDBE|nr:hypothetical protein [Kineothrix sp. MB12-C1]WMC93202.1 hypothetical protein RBB56_02650 [Kineothrix sp. MB12-C1]
MKLNIGDRVKGTNSIYEVVAIIFATVYLRAIKDNDMNYLCEMEDVYHNYLDIEII